MGLFGTKWENECGIMLSWKKYVRVQQSVAPFLMQSSEVRRMTKEWLRCAVIRAIKTVAQTATAMIGTAVVLTDVNWIHVCSASALAGLLSVLTSIAGLPEVKDE